MRGVLFQYIVKESVVGPLRPKAYQRERIARIQDAPFDQAVYGDGKYAFRPPKPTVTPPAQYHQCRGRAKAAKRLHRRLPIKVFVSVNVIIGQLGAAR